jgi:hypothetical protein
MASSMVIVGVPTYGAGRKSWRDVWRRDGKRYRSKWAVGPPTLTPDAISLETIIFLYLTYTRNYGERHA